MELRLGVKNAARPDGVAMGDLLFWLHYGTETSPPRPVLRNAAEKVIPANKDRFKAFFTNCVRNPNEQDRERMEAILLQSIGSQCISEAKKMIDSSEGLQHNAPATVSKKGFDKPLFEKGIFQKNLAYEIVK